MRQEEKLSENYYEWSRQFWKEQQRDREKRKESSLQSFKASEEKIIKKNEEYWNRMKYYDEVAKRGREKREECRISKEEEKQKQEKSVSWAVILVLLGIPALVLLVPGAPKGAYLGTLVLLTVGIPILPLVLLCVLIFLACYYKKK